MTITDDQPTTTCPAWCRADHEADERRRLESVQATVRLLAAEATRTTAGSTRTEGSRTALGVPLGTVDPSGDNPSGLAGAAVGGERRIPTSGCYRCDEPATGRRRAMTATPDDLLLLMK